MRSLRLLSLSILWILPLLATAPLEAQLGGKYGGRVYGSKRLKRARPEVVKAIALGLSWLADHQDKDGKIDAAMFMHHDKRKTRPTTFPATKLSTPAVTAFALSAFLGDGHTANHGRHDSTVAKATQWLLALIQKDGSIRGLTKTHEITEHAVVTCALLESTASAHLLVELEKAGTALDWLVDKRLPEGAFGSHTGAKHPDLLATHFAIMALRLGDDFNRGVDKKILIGARTALTKATAADGTIHTTAKPAPWRASAAAQLPIGVFTRFFAGLDPKHDDTFRALVQRLAAHPPKPAEVDADILRTLMGTQGIYQAGGTGWRSWSDVVMKQLAKSQRRDGNFRGSWDPKGKDAKVGGRVYQTALSILTLQSYFRYTRLVR